MEREKETHGRGGQADEGGKGGEGAKQGEKSRRYIGRAREWYGIVGFNVALNIL